MIYSIKHRSDKSIGRTFPQSYGMTDDYDYNAPNSIYNIVSYFKSFPPFEPNFDSFKLNDGAKVTDFISSSCTIGFPGFIVSKKALDIFTNIKMPPYKIFPAKILWKGNFLDQYYWLHIIHNYEIIVDFKNSDFYYTDDFGNEQKIAIEDSSSFSELNLKFQLKARNLFIDTENIQYDFMLLQFGINSNIVSEHFKLNMEQNNITGIQFDPMLNVKMSK